MFMKNKFVIFAFLGLIAVSSWISAYVILSQAKQIVKLQEQLQNEQMKYKVIINDPLVRDAMEAGG